MKKNIILFWLLTFALFSCVKDNGNYLYSPEELIDISGVPDVIDVMASADHIVVNPKFVSKIHGEIKENDPNYKVEYFAQYTMGGTIYGDNTKRMLLNPAGNWSLDTLASFKTNNYIVELIITDKRNNCKNSTSFKLNVSSSVSSGWLLLCNEGPQKRVRLDMISHIGDKRIPMFDILTPLGMPECHEAYSIDVVTTPSMSPGDKLYILTKDGCYTPYYVTFEINEKKPFQSTIKYTDFLAYPDENFTHIEISPGSFIGDQFRALISESGDVYAISGSGSGSVFESPINTDTPFGPTKYKVANFVGRNRAEAVVMFGMMGHYSLATLYFDTISKSFIVRSNATEESRRIMTPLIVTTGKLFETVNTGLDLIWMENTRYNNGATYAVMKAPNGDCHIYGFDSFGLYTFNTTFLDKNVTAPRFGEASQYAFSSQFPYVYYSVDNTIYCYNYVSKSSKEVVVLPAGEKVTRMRFYLFNNSSSMLTSKPESYLKSQFELSIASFDESKPGDNNGVMRFYSVDGQANTLTQKEEHKGFAKIVDFVLK